MKQLSPEGASIIGILVPIFSLVDYHRVRHVLERRDLQPPPSHGEAALNECAKTLQREIMPVVLVMAHGWDRRDGCDDVPCVDFVNKLFGIFHVPDNPEQRTRQSLRQVKSANVMSSAA